MSTITIPRAPLRDEVHRVLVERLLRHRYGARERLSDSVLAAELGVSRTPVREALLRLEREGWVEADLGRGFFVKPLSADEVREVYPVLWTLEALALRLSPAADGERLRELAALNAAFEAETEPARRIDLDMRWHSALAGGCGNPALLGMIGGLKAVIRRYEHAYMGQAALVPVSARTHEEIAGALAAGDREGAVRLLEENWRFGMEALLRWLARPA